jgi:hypothetical protein
MKRTFEQAVDDYYSSLDDNEMEEQKTWGDFALAELTTNPSPPTRIDFAQ